MVDAHVAVLMRNMKGADQRRPVPIDEMLGVGVGVLQRGDELKGVVGGLAISGQAGDVGRLADDPEGIDEGARERGRLDGWRRHGRLAVLPRHEAALP